MKIFLTSCFSLDFDLPLLRHFISHYISLGIRPENFLLVLNVFKDKNKLKEGMSILEEYGIFPKDVWCYEYESHEKWQRVHMVLSAHVRPEDWVVHPDSDEFFQFPMKLDNLIHVMSNQGMNAAQGFLIDRLANDGKIKDIVENINLGDQFPAKANLTNLIGLSGVKLMMYKGNLRANNGSGQIHDQCKPHTFYTHGGSESLSKTALALKINGDFSKKDKWVYDPGKFNESVYQVMAMQHGFFVHHFKWHGNVIEKLKQRVVTYTRLKRPQVTQSQKLLDHYEKNGRFLFGE